MHLASISLSLTYYHLHMPNDWNVTWKMKLSSALVFEQRYVCALVCHFYLPWPWPWPLPLPKVRVQSTKTGTYSVDSPRIAAYIWGHDPPIEHQEAKPCMGKCTWWAWFVTSKAGHARWTGLLCVFNWLGMHASQGFGCFCPASR